jgi:hypothetical protein
MVRSLQFTIDTERELILTLRTLIYDKEQQIQQLTQLLTAAKCNDYTSKPPERSKIVPFSNSRGGWRAKAQAASEATIPAEPDSLAKLEQRVKDQGGTT